MAYKNIPRGIFKTYLQQLPPNVTRKAQLYSNGAEIHSFTDQRFDILRDTQSGLAMFNGGPGSLKKYTTMFARHLPSVGEIGTILRGKGARSGIHDANPEW